MSGTGISRAICKSASSSRQKTSPAPHHSVPYRPDALPAAQPTRQSTEGQTQQNIIKQHRNKTVDSVVFKYLQGFQLPLPSSRTFKTVDDQRQKKEYGESGLTTSYDTYFQQKSHLYLLLTHKYANSFVKYTRIAAQQQFLVLYQREHDYYAIMFIFAQTA